MFLPSMLSLEPVGRGLVGAWVGLYWVHKHKSAIQWPCEQGKPSAELDKVSKNKTAPPSAAFLPPAESC